MDIDFDSFIFLERKYCLKDEFLGMNLNIFEVLSVSGLFEMLVLGIVVSIWDKFFLDFFISNFINLED